MRKFIKDTRHLDPEFNKRMNQNRIYIREELWIKPNLWFILIVLLISGIGIVFCFDTCFIDSVNGDFWTGVKQIVWLGFGCLTFWLVGRMDLRNAKTWTLWGVLLALLGLFLMLVIGKEVNGATRWLDFKLFTIQPPEFAKIAFVYALALLIDFNRNFYYKAWATKHVNYFWFWFIFALLFICLLLIAFASTSALITFCLLILVMAYLGEFNEKAVIVTLALGIILLGIITAKGIFLYYEENPSQKHIERIQLEQATRLEEAIAKSSDDRTNEEEFLVKNYEKLNGLTKEEDKEINNKNITPVKKKTIWDKISKKISHKSKRGEAKHIDFKIKRIAAWCNPKKYINDFGLQPAYSIMAISTGGIFGKGLGQGICKFSLPESHNDYIFATICEEGGLIMGLIIIILFFSLFYQGFKISIECKNKYGRNLAFGALFVLICEFVMNVMVTLNMIPTTGVCLPFVSCGGSATIANFWLAGILICVSRQKNMTDADISPDIIFKRGTKNKRIPKWYNPFEKNKKYIEK